MPRKGRLELPDTAGNPVGVGSHVTIDGQPHQIVSAHKGSWICRPDNGPEIKVRFADTDGRITGRTD